MNTEVFKKYWKNPSSITESDLPQIEKLINDYPYAVAIKQLYCKALLELKELSFEKELSKAAVQTNNRQAFRRFLLGDKLDKSKYLESFETPNSSNIKPVKDEEIEQETEPKEKKVTSSVPELDQQILTAASSYNIDTATEESNTQESPKKRELPKKASFSNWFDLLEGKEKTYDEVEFKEKAGKIIDEFLVNQPKIRVKKEFYSPENKAKNSIEEHFDYITETLVSIYISQGHYEKAIEGYRKLILKYPEKKVYFASQIEKLKNNNI